MGVSVHIKCPEGMPDPKEPVASFARSMGNILMATTDLGFGRLDKIDSDEGRIKALTVLIEELDEGEDGLFDATYWVIADQKWSDGREMEEFIYQRGAKKVALDMNLTTEEYWARHRRERMRKTAFRFLSYFKMGYEIEWSY